MNLIFALSSYPAGALSDRLDRAGLLAIACAVLVASELVLALSGRARAARSSASRSSACTWASRRACSPRSSRTRRRPSVQGTAFGVFHLVTGAATLVASVVAGALWERPGPDATFLAGAALALLATLSLALVRDHRVAQADA